MPEQKLGIDGFALNQYLGKVNAEARERVLESIINSKIVQDALEKPEGKIILDGPIEQYRQHIMTMVDELTNGKAPGKKKLETLLELGVQAKVQYQFIIYIAGLLMEGKKHLENVNNLKGS